MDARIAEWPPATTRKPPRSTAPLVVGEHADPAEALLQVWNGQTTASLARGALDPGYCDAVYERFVSSPARAGRADGVPGDVVGSTQYGKSPEEYMSLADGSTAAVNAIMGPPGNPLRGLLRSFARKLLSNGVAMRPLVFEGEPAPAARFARWTTNAGDGRWLLRPHDDWEQTRGYLDWEVARIDKVIAVNAYIRSQPGSGQLIVSGWRPNDEERRARGLAGTGYPYDDADLLHRPHAILPVATGDIAIIDGSHLHGVLLGDGIVEERLLANLFIGWLDGQAVFWA